MSRLNWDDLHLFLNAIEAGSYSAAGARLGLNRTTVGRRVQALEKALEQPLFEQGPEGYRPTAAGQRLLRSARAMEREVQALNQALAGEQRRLQGPLRLAAPVGLGPEFMPQFAAFSSRYPDVQLELINAQDSLASISQRKADLGLCVTNSVPGHLQGHRVTRLRRALYASPDYLRRYPAERPLAQHHWVGWGREMLHSQAAQWMGAHLPPEIHVTAAVNSWPALREAVLAGLGVGPLWCFLADSDPRLVRVRDAVPELGIDLWLLVHRDVPVNERGSAFMDYTRPLLAQRVDGAS